MDDPIPNVAETLFENRSGLPTYRVTLDDGQTFEVTTDHFEYDPAERNDNGDFRQVIEFLDPPELDLADEQYPTEKAEIDTVEIDAGWGTSVLHAAVQHVDDGGLSGGKPRARDDRDREGGD